MSAEQSRSPYLSLPASGQGRQSASPKIGSGRVKSPLPAPAAYRASCMSAAAKRYKVTTNTSTCKLLNTVQKLPSTVYNSALSWLWEGNYDDMSFPVPNTSNH